MKILLFLILLLPIAAYPNQIDCRKEWNPELKYGPELNEVMKLYKSNKNIAAINLLNTLSNKAYPVAQFLLGREYFFGNRVIKDDKKAISLMRRSANLGYFEAQLFLARVYEKGDILAKDDMRALYWFKKALIQENIRARADASMMLTFFHERRKEYRKMFEMLSFWVQLETCSYKFDKPVRSSSAMNLLGGAYEKGYGVVQDFVRAHMWYNLSSSLDDDGGRELRDRIAKRLSREDILYAQKLARECQQRQFKDC